MLKYNQEILLERDTDRYGSYLATNYEFPFPESPKHLLNINEGRYVDFIEKKIYLNDKKMRRISKKYNDLCRSLEQR